MNPATASRLMTALRELSKLYPEMRFGQLVSNVAYWAKGPTAEAVWEVDDEELLRAAEQHLQSKLAATKST
jgi:hypothetical protein